MGHSLTFLQFQLAVYPPAAPCAATREVVPFLTNSLSYQVCNAANSVVCPFVQVFFSNTTNGPPVSASSLTCANINASGVNFAPLDQTQSGLCTASPGASRRFNVFSYFCANTQRPLRMVCQAPAAFLSLPARAHFAIIVARVHCPQRTCTCSQSRLTSPMMASSTWQTSFT